MPHLYQGAEAPKEPIVVFSVVDPVVWVFKGFPLEPTQEKQCALVGGKVFSCLASIPSLPLHFLVTQTVEFVDFLQIVGDFAQFQTPRYKINIDCMIRIPNAFNVRFIC